MLPLVQEIEKQYTIGRDANVILLLKANAIISYDCRWARTEKEHMQRPQFHDTVDWLIATAMLKRGNCYSGKGNFDEARASYDFVVRQCKHKANVIGAYEALASIYMKKGEDRLAKLNLELAARLKNPSK